MGLGHVPERQDEWSIQGRRITQSGTGGSITSSKNPLNDRACGRQSISSEEPLIKLAIFTATRWEYQSVREALAVEQVTTIAGVRCTVGQRGQTRIFLFQSGIGPQKALEVSQLVLSNESWTLVVSSGFAGALVPSAIGTIVVGREVISEGCPTIESSEQTTIVCDEPFRNRVFKIACSMDEASECGVIVTLPHIVGTAAEKKEIAEHTQAIALDMESAMLGLVAHTKNIPFIVVRTISDLANENLPIDFNVFLRPHGWMKGLGLVIGKPLVWIHFLRLRRQMVKASGQLTKFFLKFFDEIHRWETSQSASPTSC